jgi:Protein of unknown function (DUF2950)
MIMLRSICRAASVGVVAAGTLVLVSSASFAQQAYLSPEDATAALASAVKSGTRSAILKVLGNAAEDIVASGDDVEDADARQRFLSAYDAKHSIKSEDNKKATLILGADDFPFPIPLVNAKSGWEFDTDAGRVEILYRRIGRNELDAIQTCLASSMPRTNMRIEIAAPAPASTRSASSAAPARRTGCSGATIATRVRSASWRRRRPPKATRSTGRARLTMAIVFES